MNNFLMNIRRHVYYENNQSLNGTVKTIICIQISLSLMNNGKRKAKRNYYTYI